MMGQRTVVPEILDSLPSDDPRAVRCRIDLHRINLAMGNYRWIASKLQAGARSDTRDWMELGAGDGHLAKILPDAFIQTIRVGAADFAPRPECWPANWEWNQGDLFEVLDSRSGEKDTGIIASLFLHHFEEADLAKMGAAFEDSFSRIIISEPARFSCFEWLARPFFPLVNHVTRHDMIVSIQAGFRKGELPRLLGLNPETWEWTEVVTLLGAYRLDARKRE